MGFGDTLRRMFGDPQPQLVDTRNSAQRGVQEQTAAEYARASSDPEYGMLSPQDQRYMEQELTRSIKNRAGAAGSGGTGYESDLIRKGIVDFRIQQMAQRQRTLDTLRQGVLQSGGMQAVSPQPGVASGAMQYGLGRGIASAFDDPDENKRRGQERNPGGGTPGDPAHGNRPAAGGMGVTGT